jgi:hypothetical protein
MITWKKRFKKARKAGHFDSRDIRAASVWNTCAVGETHRKIGDYFYHNRFDGGYPPPEKIFSKIFRLGINFGWAVSCNRIEEAEKLYKQIKALDHKLYLSISKEK